MKKTIVNSILTRAAMLLALLIMATNVAAQVVEVSDWGTFETQLGQTGENAPDVIQLTADVSNNSGTTYLIVPQGRNVTLDLNGHTLNTESGALVSSGNLIVKDTSTDGTGVLTGIGPSNGSPVWVGINATTPGTLTLESGKISVSRSIRVMAGSLLTIDGGEITCSGQNAILNLGNLVMNNGKITGTGWVTNQGNFVMNDGEISTEGDMVIYNQKNSFVLNGGSIVATRTYAVYLDEGTSAEINGGTIEALYENGNTGGIGIYALRDTEVKIYDGTITAYYKALSGDGAAPNAKFTIEGGTVTSTHGTAIFAPQPSGEVTITGGTITGARSGIEFRAGTLNVQGGTITGNTQTYDTSDAGNGIIGSAVAVVQHTNKQVIRVNISGGTLIGYLPLSEHNTNGNTDEDLRKIYYAITGGLFHSTGTETINIEDYLNGPFAVGGRFTHSVAQYVASGYFEFQDSNADPIYVCLPYLADGMNYLQTSDSDVDVATYTKTLGAERIGKHQAWFVPFDYTITAVDEAKFTFYKINMIANSPSPSQEATGEMWVFLTKLSADDVLHANMPYVYKPKDEVTNYTFTSNNVTLKAKNTGVVLKTETAEDIYSFYGTYNNTTATTGDSFYYVGIDGNISYGDAVTVGPYRWIVRKTNKFGGSVSYARKMHFFDGEEDDDATGVTSLVNENENENQNCFDLAGRKVKALQKGGIYIVNGKKVIIK